MNELSLNKLGLKALMVPLISATIFGCGEKKVDTPVPVTQGTAAPTVEIKISDKAIIQNGARVQIEAVTMSNLSQVLRVVLAQSQSRERQSGALFQAYQVQGNGLEAQSNTLGQIQSVLEAPIQVNQLSQFFQEQKCITSDLKEGTAIASQFDQKLWLLGTFSSNMLQGGASSQAVSQNQQSLANDISKLRLVSISSCREALSLIQLVSAGQSSHQEGSTVQGNETQFARVQVETVQVEASQIDTRLAEVFNFIKESASALLARARQVLAQEVQQLLQAQRSVGMDSRGIIQLMQNLNQETPSEEAISARTLLFFSPSENAATRGAHYIRSWRMPNITSVGRAELIGFVTDSESKLRTYTDETLYAKALQCVDQSTAQANDMRLAARPEFYLFDRVNSQRRIFINNGLVLVKVQSCRELVKFAEDFRAFRQDPAYSNLRVINRVYQVQVRELAEQAAEGTSVRADAEAANMSEQVNF